MNFTEQKALLNAALADLEALIAKHGVLNIAAAMHAAAIKSVDFAEAMVRVTSVARQALGERDCQCPKCVAERNTKRGQA